MAKLPDTFKKIYSKDQIADRAAAIGGEITAWAHSVSEDTGQDVLAIPVLRGGIFFFADIVRDIDASVQVVPVQSWAYDENEVIRAEIKISMEGVSAEGRSVLLVDDICDSGKTLRALVDAFERSGAKEVKTAVLIKRDIEDSVFDPNYVGFHYADDEWFVGYGMDDNDRWKNLPDIYVIERDSE